MDDKIFFVNLNFLLYWTLISSNFKFYTQKKKKEKKRLHLGVRQNGSEFLDALTKLLFKYSFLFMDKI